MADEVTASAYLRVENSGGAFERYEAKTEFDQTGTNATYCIQEIGTSAENLTVVADIGSNGWGFFKNLHSSASIEIGVDVSATFYPFVKLLAGEFALIPLADSITVQGKASATADLEYAIFER